ncbi:MAG: hypothetical protein NPIRA04_29970 [Nitrospirales bacterium]|nr:MAG: hypothetical protein NPIRA04_29970 [Nitrospirales bacterium]
MWYLKTILIASLSVSSLLILNAFASPQAFEREMVEPTDDVERNQIVQEVIHPFIRALQLGDTVTLERYIDGDLGVMIGKLVRENKAYPQFLRDHYGGSKLRGSIEVFRPRQSQGHASSRKRKKDDDIVSAEGSLSKKKIRRTAVVSIDRVNGPSENFHLSLRRDQQGTWKVVGKR